jgi:hypothetical protein
VIVYFKSLHNGELIQKTSTVRKNELQDDILSPIQQGFFFS